MIASTLVSLSSPSTETIIVLATRPGEREDVAVREVDQLQDPVDERVAERDEAVDEPFVSPISPTWMNSVGSLTKLPTSQTPTSATSDVPEEPRDSADFRSRVERSRQCLPP